MFSVIRHDELRAMIDRNDAMVIVDVRSSESFLKGHLPGAISLEMKDGFETLAGNMIPDKSIPVIVYCGTRDDQSSAEAAQKLAELGYKNVSDYENGLDEWEREGHPLGD